MHAMAKALLEWETIDAEQIDDIMAGKSAASAQGLDALGQPGLPGAVARTPRSIRRRAAAADLKSLTCGASAPLFMWALMELQHGPCHLANHPVSDPLDRPVVMGIVNVTPDSFSDGGRTHRTRAMAHCEQLLKEGADILDIGGESTRPGADPLSLEAELARVLPVLREALKLGVPVSVDTYKAEVMRQSLDLGVDIINDIAALRAQGAVQVVAAHPGCGSA
jgi:hypothetical protein